MPRPLLLPLLLPLPPLPIPLILCAVCACALFLSQPDDGPTGLQIVCEEARAEALRRTYPSLRNHHHTSHAAGASGQGGPRALSPQRRDRISERAFIESLSRRIASRFAKMGCPIIAASNNAAMRAASTAHAAALAGGGNASLAAEEAVAAAAAAVAAASARQQQKQQ
jgi:hypothetical protein